MGAETHADDKIQSQGRTDNAARPLNDAPDNAGAERYPSVNKDDSIDPGAANPQPRQGAGDGGPRPSAPPPSTNPPPSAEPHRPGLLSARRRRCLV